MCSVIMALARPLVLTLYGPKWIASANVLSFLTIYAAVSLICVLVANIISSMGYPKLLLAIQLVWLFTLAPAMVIGVHEDGIVGAAFAHIAVICPIVLPCYLVVLKRATGVTFRMLAGAVVPALGAAVVAGLVAKGAASQFNNSLAQLLVGALSGGAIYVFVALPQFLSRLKPTQLKKLKKNPIFRGYVNLAKTLGVAVNGGPRHAAPRDRAAKPVRAYEPN
jgi:PST family polysaccharide transporter